MKNKKEDVKRAGKPSQARFLLRSGFSQPSITGGRALLLSPSSASPAYRHQGREVAPAGHRIRLLLAANRQIRRPLSRICRLRAWGVLPVVGAPCG